MKVNEKISSIVLPVEGMSCGNCAERIEGELKSVSGVMACIADYLNNKVTVDFESNRTHGDVFIKKIESLGYSVPVVQSGASDEAHPFAEVLEMAEAEGRDIITRDPVCGMMVKKADYAVISEYEGDTYFFCDPPCKEKFDRNPDRFIKSRVFHE